MKKTIKSTMLFAAAAMAFTGCVKADFATPEVTIYEYVFKVSAPETKAILGEAAVEYEAGDKLGIFAASSSQIEASLDVTTTPVTVKVQVPAALPAGTIVYAYYPFSASNSAATANAVTLSIPSEQNQDGVTYDADAMPMAAVPYEVKAEVAEESEVAADDLYMKNLAAVAQFNVYAAEASAEKILSVKFESTTGIAGEFVCDLTSAQAPESLSGNVVTTSVTSDLVVGTSAAKAEVYMVLAPGDHAGSVTVLTDKGEYIFNVETPITFQRSVVKPLGLNLANADQVVKYKGGIENADDLVAFAAAVNAGESLAPWTNADGRVVLLNDIDMQGVTSWTPIGSSTIKFSSNVPSLTSGRMFTGYFDGQGHSIKNFAMNCTNSTANAAWGLFGCAGPGAVIKNIVFDSSCTLTVNPTAYTDCGLIAGILWDARVIDITNYAPMNFTATAGLDAKRITMGIVGAAHAQNDSSVVRRVVNKGAMTATGGGSDESGGNAIHVAGIVGFSNSVNSPVHPVVIEYCDNHGNMTSATGRTSGIVAAANQYTHIRNCDNFGDQMNTFEKSKGARLGNITALTGAGCAIYDTRNFGDIISTTSGAVSGILCLVNNDANIFVRVETYGDVVSDMDYSYKGYFFAQNQKTNAVFEDCVVGGRIGKYNGGTYQFEEATAANFWNFMGKTKDADHIAAMKPYFTFTTVTPSVE